MDAWKSEIETQKTLDTIGDRASFSDKRTISTSLNLRLYGETNQVCYKIVFIGPSGAGKTSLIRHYTDNVFENDHFPTFGMLSHTKTVKVKDKIAKLVIWDTPDYAVFQSQIEKNYQNADAIVFVYDRTKAENIRQVENMIAEVAKSVNHAKVCLMALLNRRVYTSRVSKEFRIDKDLLDFHSVIHHKSRAKSRESVKKLFDELINELTTRNASAMMDSPMKIFDHESTLSNSSDESYLHDTNEDLHTVQPIEYLQALSSVKKIQPIFVHEPEDEDEFVIRIQEKRIRKKLGEAQQIKQAIQRNKPCCYAGTECRIF